MIRLHYAPLSRALRIHWLLEEMGLEYEIVPIDIEKVEEGVLRDKNPLSLVPVLEDGDAVVFESAAIIEYLLDRYGERGLRPERGSPEHVRYLAWLSAGETVTLPLGGYLEHTLDQPGFDAAGGVMRPEIAADHKARFERYLEGVERTLEGQDWIVGETFTAADVMLAYAVLGATMFSLLDAERFPNVAAYAARLSARPAAKTVLPGAP